RGIFLEVLEGLAQGSHGTKSRNGHGFGNGRSVEVQGQPLPYRLSLQEGLLRHRRIGEQDKIGSFEVLRQRPAGGFDPARIAAESRMSVEPVEGVIAEQESYPVAFVDCRTDGVEHVHLDMEPKRGHHQELYGRARRRRVLGLRGGTHMIVLWRPGEQHPLFRISAFKKELLSQRSHRTDIVRMRDGAPVRIASEFNRRVKRNEGLFMIVAAMLDGETYRAAARPPDA